MTGVYGLQRSQFGMAVALLQQQYMEDPLWKHVFPDVEERRVGARSPRSARCLVCV